MKLTEVLEHVTLGTKLLITMKIDTGEKESFSVEITRGQRAHTWRTEYGDWLKSLDLEVETLSAVGCDTSNNKDMLCIHCKPIKLRAEQLVTTIQEEEIETDEDTPGDSGA